MTFNQPKNKKSMKKTQKTQTFSFAIAISILILGVIIYMSHNIYKSNHYSDLAEGPFLDLLTLSEINSLVESGKTDDVYTKSEELSPKYEGIKDLLLGDSSYHAGNFNNAKSFYNLAINDKSSFVKKGAENRSIFIGFKE
jgi:hypothetical protein